MIKPTGNLLLIELEKFEEKTEGGIYKPEIARDREKMYGTKGVVLAMGPAAFDTFGENMCETGDTIIFAKYGGYLTQDPETKEEFRLILDRDVLAVIMTAQEERQRKAGQIIRAYRMELEGALKALEIVHGEYDGTINVLPPESAIASWTGEKNQEIFGDLLQAFVDQFMEVMSRRDDDVWEKQEKDVA